MKAPHHFRIKPPHPYGSLPSDGNEGAFIIPHYRIANYEFVCIISSLLGWEHVSVTINPKGRDATRCPTWEEMCFIKDQFWDKDEVVIQYHPREADYVSEHEYCLHLWRPTNQHIPIPPTTMVGTK